MTRDETINSAGQTATGAAWLDLHFEACRPEYEHIVDLSASTAGWHVLDAGCGGGSFIPVLADLVGPNGKITAMDHAPENVEAVRNRLESTPVQCDVEPKVGSVVDIPLDDNEVDAVWIANVLMYLSDDELETALKEIRRVDRAYIGSYLATTAGLTIERNADRHSEEDLALWQVMRDPQAPEHPLNSPDFYWCEGQAVAVARVPQMRTDRGHF